MTNDEKTEPNADLPVLEGWVGVGGAAEILGYSRQHTFRLFKQRRFNTLRRLADSHTVVVSVAELAREREARRRETCVHCGEPLIHNDLGSGLFTHAHGLQRCQSDSVPYGHMGHPSLPCPTGDINPCAGSREEICTHTTEGEVQD